MVTATRNKLSVSKYLSRRVDEIEAEIQKMKMILPSETKKGVVKRTGGVLGKTFASGLRFQKKLRTEWEKRGK